MCVMVMECTVQYREMCYGISICNVCNGDGGQGISKCNVTVMQCTVEYREMCYGKQNI